MIWTVLGIVILLGIIGIWVVSAVIRRKGKVEQPDHYIKGLKLLADGEKKEAIKELRKAVFSDTENIDAYIRLGELYREMGDAEKAIGIHQSLTARPMLSKEDEVRIYRDLVEDYLADGRTHKAISVLYELVRLTKDLKDIKKLMILYLTRDMVEEAIGFLKDNEKLIKDRVLLSGYYTEVGNKIKEREPQKSYEFYKKAEKIYSSNPHLILSLAGFYEDKGDTKNAYTYIKRFTEDPSLFVIENLDVVERILFSAKKYENIGKIYRMLLDKFKNNTYLLLKLAKFYLKRGEARHAKEILEERYMHNPKDPLLLSGMIRIVARGNKEVLKLVDELESVLEQEVYRCRKCTEKVEKFSWFCPYCGEYMSVERMG